MVPDRKTNTTGKIDGKKKENSNGMHECKILKLSLRTVYEFRLYSDGWNSQVQTVKCLLSHARKRVFYQMIDDKSREI